MPITPLYPYYNRLLSPLPYVQVTATVANLLPIPHARGHGHPKASGQLCSQSDYSFKESLQSSSKHDSNGGIEAKEEI